MGGEKCIGRSRSGIQQHFGSQTTAEAYTSRTWNFRRQRLGAKQSVRLHPRRLASDHSGSHSGLCEIHVRQEPIFFPPETLIFSSCYVRAPTVAEQKETLKRVLPCFE